MRIDFVTLTADGELGDLYALFPPAEGEQGKDWYERQFVGACKTTADGWLAWGESDGRELLRATGELSHRICQIVAEGCPPPNLRCTRLDICRDVREPADIVGFFNSEVGKGKSKLSMVSNETLYVGSPKSERQWRVYDKAAQLERDDLAPLWRWEITLRGDRAKQAWHAILQEGLTEETLFRYWSGSMSLPMHRFATASGAITDADQGKDEFIEALPRKPKGGIKFLRGSVIPFLRANPWAREIVRKEIG